MTRYEAFGFGLVPASGLVLGPGLTQLGLERRTLDGPHLQPEGCQRPATFVVAELCYFDPWDGKRIQ